MESYIDGGCEVISVSCNCTYSSQVPDTFNGKTVPCPKCGQPITIGTGTAPTPTASTSASAPESRGVSTTDIIAPKKKSTAMMAFPLFGDGKKDEEPRADAPSTRRLIPCGGCRAGMSERERYCSKCGWDTKENVRKCRKCEMPFILHDGAGSTGAQLGISAVIGGIVGYLTNWAGGAAVAFLMGSVGALINGFTAGFKCTGCNKGIEAGLMSPDEKKVTGSKRISFMIVSVVLLIVSGGLGAYWYTNFFKG